MAKFASDLESLNRMIPSLPLQTVGEETIAKIQVRLCQLETSDLPAPEANSTDRSKCSNNPRLYTFLRSLSTTYEHKEVVSVIRKTKITDYSIPTDPVILQQLRSGIDEKTFQDIQASFLSHDSRMSLENLKGSPTEHRRLENGQDFLETIKTLGVGAFATVHHVRHRVSKAEYACKRVQRGPVTSQHTKLQDFLNERNVLQQLDHVHIVKLVASYTDTDTFSLILSPVASGTLESFLEHMSSSLGEANVSATAGFEKNASILRHAFGCLLSTLVYLESQCVRHRDIKPTNILLDSEGRVRLCDFGSSLDYSSTKEATTEGISIGHTRGYCAPEVERGEPRNTLSDVWSLGRVFFEMVAVLRKRPVQHAKNSIGKDGERIGSLISKYLAGLLSEPNSDCDNAIINHTVHMTAYDPAKRPKAVHVLQEFPFNDCSNHSLHSYIGSCCRPIGSANSPKQKKKPLSFPNQAFDSILDSGAAADLTESTVHRSLHLSGTDIECATTHDSSRDASIEVTRSHTRPGKPSPPSNEFQDVLSNVADVSEVPILGQSPQTDHYHHSTRSSSAQSQPNQSLESIDVPPSTTLTSSDDGPSSVSPRGLVGCLCVPRSIESGSAESQLFSAPFTTIRTDTWPRTAEQDFGCTSLYSRVYLFESYLPRMRNSSAVWTKTRRLVISDVPIHLGMRRCKSLWVPLADIQYTCDGREVTLRWSDCDQRKEQRSGDSNLTYSRVYQPKDPNIKVSIVFSNAEAAQRLIYVVTHAELDETISWERFGTAHVQELRGFQVKTTPSYCVLHVSQRKGIGVESKLFIQRTPSILDVWTHPLTSVLGPPNIISLRFCSLVSTPHYYSNVIDAPSDDNSVIAECSKADLVFSEYRLDFSLTQNTDAAGVPNDLQNILAFLTHWTIRFLASGVKVCVPRVIGKDYGYADLILWEHNQVASIGTSRPPVLAFRKSGVKKDYLWRTGTITSKSQAIYKFPYADITIFGKSCGNFLGLSTNSVATKMEEDLRQIQESNTLKHSRKQTGQQKGSNESNTLRFQFGSPADFERFFVCFNRLLAIAKVNA